MTNSDVSVAEATGNASPAESTESMILRDIMGVVFRQRRLLTVTFGGIFFISVAVALLVPRQYTAEMKILVRPQTVEPAISREHGPSLRWQAPVSEEELRSEGELIKSRDVLAMVVVACGLADSARSSWGKVDTNEQKIARAILAMEKDLTVEPVNQTNLIRVSYNSADPQLAAKVLNSLASMYVEKHLQMPRAPNQSQFFHELAEEHRKALAKDEQNLINFDREQGVLNLGLEKEMTLRKVAEFGAESRTARANIAETRERIHALEAQLANLPKRETKEAPTTPENPALVQTLKAKLQDLESRRTALLAEFKPADHIVQETDDEIAQTRTAIALAQGASSRNKANDRAPYEALYAELAKAKTELAATESRAATASSLTQTYRAESEQLDRQEFQRQDLLRTAKADEDSYLLYLRREEEERIADATERQRFSNVVVAEPAAVPFRPQMQRLRIVTLGVIIAALISMVVAFLADRLDPSFRTPKEVESFIGSPVVAAIPKSGD